MANRISNLNTFANLSPPWLLSSLDQNSNFITTGFNDSSLGFGNGIPTDTGTANNYVIALPYGSPSAYNPGMLVGFTPANTNTGASTLTVTPLGMVSILNAAGLALSGGEIILNKTLWMMYSSVTPIGFRIISHCPLTRSLVNPGNITINCAGYDSISVFVQMNSAATSLILQNVGYGVPIVATLYNNTGSSLAYALTLFDVTGTQVTAFATFPSSSTGGLGIDLSNPQALNANCAITFSGMMDQVTPGVGGGAAHFSV